MVNTQAIERSRYNFSTSIDIIAFLSIHQLVFKGKIDAFESEDEGENGLFLNMFIYTVKNDQCLCAIIKLSLEMQCTFIPICKTNLLLL